MKGRLGSTSAAPYGAAFWWPAPRAMLLLGVLGMAIGMLIDSHGLPPGALASICGPANRGLWSVMRSHGVLLPWTHVGMWAGGLAAIPLLRTARPRCRGKYCARLVQNLVCSLWMTLGMSATALLFEGLGEPSTARLVAAMLLGMTWGMITGIALYRFWLRVRPFLAPAFGRHAEVPQP